MTGTTAAASRATHILVFPFPAQGHMLPLLDFTHQIATQSRSQSQSQSPITITILVTPKNIFLLNPLLSAHPSIQTLVLPFPSHPSIPDGVENLKDMPPTSFRYMIPTLGGLRGPLGQWFRSHPSPPTAIVSDVFLGWTQRLAAELGIRRVVFSPSGALALSMMHSLWRDLPRRQDPNDVVSFPEIPNSPKYPWWQLSPLYRSYVEGDPDSEFVRDGFVANRASWGLAVNSFSEMEGAYLEHLRRDSGHDRVWAVGPVPRLADDLSGPTKRGGSSSVSVDQISSWLDKCGDRKVVYVCFGSQAVLHNDQMEELAKSLEKSGVHFVWSVKRPSGVDVEGDYGRVPPGFEDRVAGRGIVIRGWAPQVLILNHRAVGAFLTHCGWNSVLEAVAAGVPMLAWPLGADQFANATLLVDQLKVATTVCEGKSAVPDSAKLAPVLVESLGEKQVERQRVARLCHAALEATKERGSSTKDLESLIGHLAALHVSNC